MFGFSLNAKRLAVLSLFAVLVGGSTFADAQVSRRARRESNANRKARIARTIEETYSHRWEVFGGGGYLRFRSGQYLQKNNEITWATSATYFLNPKLGIQAQASGSYGNAKIGNTIFGIKNPLITEYNFMAGPTYRVYAKQRLAASVFAVGGISLGNFDGGSKGISAPLLGMWQTADRPVVSAGVNLDYNLYPNLALRVTPTYVGTLFRGVDQTTGNPNGSIQNNLGFNAGIVYRFGRIGKK
jgi:hypothetical protein